MGRGLAPKLPLSTCHGTEALGALELVGEVNAAAELTLQLRGVPLLFGFWGARRDTQREKRSQLSRGRGVEGGGERSRCPLPVVLGLGGRALPCM